MTSFPAFIRLKMTSDFCLHKKEIAGRLEDMNFIFSWWNHQPEKKIQMFAPPCNILCVFSENRKIRGEVRNFMSVLYDSLFRAL